MCPGRGHYYWTDRRLQVLVNTYYMYLREYKSDSRGEGSGEKSSAQCLAYLKKSLDGNVSIPKLKSQLNKIFDDYEEMVSCFLCFLVVFFVKYRVAHQIFNGIDTNTVPRSSRI